MSDTIQHGKRWVWRYYIALEMSHASNEKNKNAILTAFLGGSIPTGSYSNGSADASVTPTLARGKGFGPFDVQSTLGAKLPIANSNKLGQPIAWNTALQ